jgi:3',5'-cyclic AMP phosphodiesterase CpdA
MKRTTAPAAALLAAVLALLASCAGVQYRYPSLQGPGGLLGQPAPAYPAARFAVFSDPHLYDPGLGTEGPAFQEYMLNERKLVSAGPELLAAALRMVRESGAQFLLVPGDLTKDGERQSHLVMAARLGELAREGVRVYVVPGNHDIMNPAALGYSAAGTAPVANVTPAEFADIYREFGYGDAQSRDPGSLSYVAEPVPGLWLVAVDSANYADNAKRKTPQTGAGFTQERVSWIEGVLADALRKGKAVIVMEHHGVVEHYTGNQTYYPQYLANGWKQLSDMYAAYHARAVFTGHFHSQDVTLKATPEDGTFLYDVETGSLLTFPNPVRTVEIRADQRMVVSSVSITDLPSYRDRGVDFGASSRDFMRKAGDAIAISTMKSLGVPKADTDILAPQVTDAIIAHVSGDERFTGSVMLGAPKLSLMANLVVSLRKDQVAGLWQDLPPADNDLTIDLAGGGWTAGQ